MSYADEMDRIDQHREQRYAELAVEGVDLSSTYTDQEGCCMFMNSAVCPRCEAKARLSYRIMPSGYFVCPSCDTMYDEPVWTDPEGDFITNVDDTDT